MMNISDIFNFIQQEVVVVYPIGALHFIKSLMGDIFEILLRSRLLGGYSSQCFSIFFSINRWFALQV